MDVTLEEKALIVARYIPCDHCSCQGWRSTSPLLGTKQNEQLQRSDNISSSSSSSNSNICDCGHGILEHVEHWKDIDRRLQLALRINDILKENDKNDNDNYTNDTILTLQRQILENVATENSLSKSTQGDLFAKRDQQDSSATGNEPKRQKTDMYNHIIEEELDEATTHAINNSTQQRLPVDTPPTATENIPKNSALSPLSLDTTGSLLLEKESANDGDNDTNGSIKQLEEHTYDNRDPLTMIEKQKGDIVTKFVLNDGQPENMIYLTGLKNIFQKQLPMMPKEYITRLVYDRNHRCIALIRRPLKVIGGICYRPFDEQGFAEIVFCAVSSTEQVRGYGAHLMNYLKDHITTHTVMRHFLTYADNSATGYFKKQGFTTDITLERRKWVGFIKDYEGGTIMQCTVTPDVDYLQQQQVGQVSSSRGLEMQMDDMDPLSVPGFHEPNQASEMDMSIGTKHPPHYIQMRHLVSELQDHANSWPFRKPVKEDEVTDYYQVIRNPMDLATLERNVKGDVYTTMNEFTVDVQKIFDNCRTYNPEGTIYAKCAAILEEYFYERIKMWNGSVN